MKDEFSLEAKIYDKVWGKHGYDSDVKFLNGLFRKHDCRSVIDIGCGTGNHAVRLSKLGYEVTGVDVSASMLKIAREKDGREKIRFKQGDMKRIRKVVPKTQKFDAAICLGQAFSSMITDRDVQAFFNGLHSILKQNGLFVFCARNAKKIKEEYLNKLRLDHMINEEKLQLLILAYNTRDTQDPSVIIWKPMYLINENNKVGLQIREHKLRWFDFSTLKKMTIESGFEVEAVYSGSKREKFKEDEHTDMWFVTTAK
jgi:ubiquinone/menaquinone biosynthesis C-methylase UbiE